MKRIKPIPALLLTVTAAALAGCSTLSVSHDYDTSVDFAQYRSYDWMEKPGSAPTGAAATTLGGGLFDRRVRAAIEGELADRGLAQTDVDPDLLVVYHVGVEDRIRVTDFGYHYSPYYWGFGGRDIDVHQYKQGTLIIDLVDAETKNLVWRGSGTKVLEQQQRSPEEAQRRTNEIVARIMASYPPDRD